jgi:hypothetical protein
MGWAFIFLDFTPRYRYTQHLVAVPFTSFGNFELFVFERDILKQRYGC